MRDLLAKYEKQTLIAYIMKRLFHADMERLRFDLNMIEWDRKAKANLDAMDDANKRSAEADISTLEGMRAFASAQEDFSKCCARDDALRRKYLD